jgi:hypothetical protein
LAYFPDAELSDGAAEAESSGFFDVFNEPPWDCWVAWAEAPGVREDSYRAFLVAWIPEQLASIVGRAIDVNPEQCIQWLHALPSVYAVAAGAHRPASV